MVPLPFAFITISRIPDTTSVREKMLYASSLDALKAQLTGIKHFVQVNEKSDLNKENFLDLIPGRRK